MSNSRKKFPAGPMCKTGRSEGRIMKRAKAKRERRTAHLLLIAGEQPDFAITPSRTWDIGDGKRHYLNDEPDMLIKLLRK